MHRLSGMFTFQSHIIVQFKKKKGMIKQYSPVDMYLPVQVKSVREWGLFYRNSPYREPSCYGLRRELSLHREGEQPAARRRGNVERLRSGPDSENSPRAPQEEAAMDFVLCPQTDPAQASTC